MIGLNRRRLAWINQVIISREIDSIIGRLSLKGGRSGLVWRLGGEGEV